MLHRNYSSSEKEGDLGTLNLKVLPLVVVGR